jgi:hypothetical protein
LDGIEHLAHHARSEYVQESQSMGSTMTLPLALADVDSALPAEIADSLFRMTVDQYERPVETGLLDGQPIELINGLLVQKTGKNRPHSWTVEALREERWRLLPPG